MLHGTSGSANEKATKITPYALARRTRDRYRACVGLTLFLLLYMMTRTSSVHAGSERPAASPKADWDLAWSAPAGCPSEEEVVRELRRRVRQPFQSRFPVGVQAVVTRRDDDYEMILTLSYGGSTQTMSYAEKLCQVHVETIELQLNSLREIPAPLAENTRLTMYLRPDVVETYGTLGKLERGPLIGVQLSGGLSRRRWSFEIGVKGQWSSWSSYVPPSGLVDWRLLAGHVRGCYSVMSRPTIELPLCAGVDVGRFGVDRDRSGLRLCGLGLNAGGALLLAVHIGPGARWWFHPKVGLWVGLNVVISIPTLAIRVDSMNEVMLKYPAVRMETGFLFRLW